MYARAMGLTDADGAPLPSWSTPEEAFDVCRAATAGRPVDYTGLSDDKLRGPTGFPWPVNDQAPEGTDRLYTDPVFPTDTDQCETYGHDLLTGAAVTEQEHRTMAPAGRAFLKGAAYTRPTRSPARTTRCATRPAGPSTSFTPAPRQVDPVRCTRQCRTPGSSSRRPTQAPWASLRATW